jgi:hypothetical protein
MCDKSIKYNEIIMPYLLVTMTWDTIVPMSAICPTPMAKYNSWTAPTNTPATGA